MAYLFFHFFVHQHSHRQGAKPTGTSRLQDSDALHSSLVPDTSLERIVIVGGGLTGIHLASKLDNERFQVVVVDRNSTCNIHPLRYKYFSETYYSGHLSIPFENLVREKRNTHFTQTEALQFHTAEDVLVTKSGKIKYCKLIIAGGNCPALIQHAESDGTFFCNPTGERFEPSRLLQYLVICMQAEKNDIVACSRYRNLVVVGGGTSGVEIAAELAELKRRFVAPDPVVDLQLRNIQIFLTEKRSRILADMSPSASEKAMRFLKNLDVKVLLNARAMHFSDNRICFEDYNFLSSYACIWTERISSRLIGGLPYSALSGDGRIITDLNCRVKGCSNVFAVGPVAYVEEDGHSYGTGIFDSKRNAEALIQNLNDPEGRWSVKLPQRRLTAVSIGWNRAVVSYRWLTVGGTLAKLIWLFEFLRIIPGYANKLNFLIKRLTLRCYYSRYCNFLVARPSVLQKLSFPFRMLQRIFQR